MGREESSPNLVNSGLQGPKRQRRTKGPSEKIRSLAALSLAAKVAYLRLDQLVGDEGHRYEAMFSEKFPRRTFEAGEVISPGERAEPMLFYVKSGSVNIYRPSSIGRRFFIKKVEPGTMFGELPMMGQSMLGAHAEAAETTEIIMISATDFEELIEKSPIIALNLMSQIGPRLVEAERRHEQAAFQPVKSRVAALLIKLADQSSQVIGYTHQEMADLLGVYRETVTNAIAELKRDGLIGVGRKKIILLDIPSLMKLETI